MIKQRSGPCFTKQAPTNLANYVALLAFVFNCCRCCVKSWLEIKASSPNKQYIAAIYRDERTNSTFQ